MRVIKWPRSDSDGSCVNKKGRGYKGFYSTSSLGTFSTLRRLLSIVKVGRVPDLRDFERAV